MQNIVINNKVCVFLNHHQLIKELYRKHLDTNNKSYSLKPELFDFKSKITADIVLETSPNLKQNKKRRKAESENEDTLKEKLYLQPFLNEIQKILVVYRNKHEDLPRLWEDPQEFPQFRGANATNDFQSTKFGQQYYIVPPNTKFFNYNIEDLPKLLPELETYDLLIIDMPWQNKYIKRLKKVKTSLGYQMLDNDTLKNMPLSQLIHTNSLVLLWCTNAQQHRRALEEFIPNWNLQLVHTLKWYKINSLGELIGPPKLEGFKQPYELLYIACHKERDLNDLNELTKVDFLVSTPSIIHSHKPPLVEWIKKCLTNFQKFKGLEIFARYLQPEFTSIGLEVLKLMDKRLYILEH